MKAKRGHSSTAPPIRATSGDVPGNRKTERCPSWPKDRDWKSRRWLNPASRVRIPPSPPSFSNRSPARKRAGQKRGGTRKNEEPFPFVRSTSRVRPCGNVLQEEGAAAGHAAEAGGNARPVRRTARPDGGRTGKEGRRARGRQEGLDGREDRGGVQGEESEETGHHPGGLRIQGARHRPDPEDRPLPPPFRDDGRPDHFRLRRSVQPGLQHRDPGGRKTGVQGMAFRPVSGHSPVRARQIRSEPSGGRKKVIPLFKEGLSGGTLSGAPDARRGSSPVIFSPGFFRPWPGGPPPSSARGSCRSRRGCRAGGCRTGSRRGGGPPPPPPRGGGGPAPRPPAG